MRVATGPYYGQRRVDEMSDEELVSQIELLRCQGIERFICECLDHVNFSWTKSEIRCVFEEQFGLDPMSVESAAVRELQKHSPEGWGDAAARKMLRPAELRDYTALWNEFIDRSMTRSIPEPRSDGGWDETRRR